MSDKNCIHYTKLSSDVELFSALNWLINHFNVKNTCCIIDFSSIFMNLKYRETFTFAIFFLCSSKRTVDFGLGRGLSGAIEAKHRLGMAAANFAGLCFLEWLNDEFVSQICLFFIILFRWTRTSATIWKCCLNSSIQLQTLYKATPNRFHELRKQLKQTKNYKTRKKRNFITPKVALIFKLNTFDFIRSKFSIFTKQKKLGSFWELRFISFLLELNDEINDDGWMEMDGWWFTHQAPIDFSSFLFSLFHFALRLF